ncbi:SMR domain-containing protein [Schizosaccharomyces cryophilus OY26]|uniref:SMR domain-containing protein n=1 Tax=Schizosaccharomyces cryophilus (strain OY26 / ATCC MYA-4695 / CBS 11777 / NBRC 106824 / NRRL Y48691) TaxID=653667 RepID=S9VV37_SCHCR|nr:SMR domain-containing protein [Schizosaccharomyces cryophilus OY26]EPY50059.1 SMR domain-containing protein [Schizosaccharomyces cryophilus OY26]
MPDWRSQFEEHYSQYLDSALVLAIVNDCENTNDAREVLETLKNDGQCLSHEDGWNQSQAKEEESAILQTLDDELNAEHEVDYSEELIDCPYDLDGTVYNFLRSMFHGIAPQRVQYVLSKCGNDLTRASDELLNQEVLEKDEGLGNATDALFAAPNASHRSRQRKRKTKKPNASRRALSMRDLNSEENHSEVEDELVQFTVQKLSFWERNQQLFEKISSILDIANSRVSHEFYKNSGSLYFTVNALLQSHPLKTQIFEKSCEDNASELSRNTGLSLQFCCELLTCCKDLQGARWIAYAVKQSHPKDTSKLELGLRAGNEKLNISTPFALKHNLPERDNETEAYSTEDCNRLADEYLECRNAEYAASARDYRRSKSDRLLGGSATYHAQVGREYHEKAMKWRGLAMRSLVQTGTPYSLDLHGATVREAKVIVEERISSWWAKEADSSPNCIHPFRIITGIGNHSVGMEARLLPSIVRWLQQNGWRFEVNHGQVEVYGAIRKKVK